MLKCEKRTSIKYVRDIEFVNINALHDAVQDDGYVGVVGQREHALRHHFAFGGDDVIHISAVGTRPPDCHPRVHIWLRKQWKLQSESISASASASASE